ncbi:MAG: leucyl aminopeptidase, partial [Lachnospiraceae bacterium]|nr:leucyl aminopeptidase [Lachnospiraceae bacterium]
MMKERFVLAKERLSMIKEEKTLQGKYGDYFEKTADFLTMVCGIYEEIVEGKYRSRTLPELKESNYKLYEDILPENYENSYANPTYTVVCFGEEYGKLLCFLSAELRSVI